MTKTILKLAVAVGIVLLGLATAPQAQAGPNMAMCITTAPGDVGGDCESSSYNDVYITSDGTAGGTTIVANGVTAILGTQVTVAAGVISFNGSIGGWSINVSTGINNGNDGIDLNSVNKTSTAGTLDVYFQTDGVSGSTPFTAQIGGTNPAGGTTTYDGCITSNDLFIDFCAFQNDVGATTFSATGGFSKNYGNITPASSPFGLMEELNLVAGSSGGTFSGDYSLVPVPEPSSIVLFGGALLIACGAMRRKVQKS